MPHPVLGMHVFPPRHPVGVLHARRDDLFTEPYKDHLQGTTPSRKSSWQPARHPMRHQMQLTCAGRAIEQHAALLAQQGGVEEVGVAHGGDDVAHHVLQRQGRRVGGGG